MQWGTLDFHRRSLRNLGEAMRRTRKLCAIMVDTIGRELIINREVQIDDKGWPKHEGRSFTVSKGDKVWRAPALLRWHVRAGPAPSVLQSTGDTPVGSALPPCLPCLVTPAKVAMRVASA